MILFGLVKHFHRLAVEGDLNGGERAEVLVMAVVALLQFSGVQLTVFVMPALGADEAVWPVHFEDCIEALLLGVVVLEGFGDAEAFLELYGVKFYSINNMLYQ